MMSNQSDPYDGQSVLQQTELESSASPLSIIEEDAANATGSTAYPMMAMSKVLNYINTTMAAATVNTVVDVPYEDYKYRPETYIVPIIFGIIFIAGLTGNGMLIAVFIKHRAMRNVPNT